MWLKKIFKPEYNEIPEDFKQLDDLALGTLEAYNQSSSKFAETRRGKRTWEQELGGLFGMLPQKALRILDLGCGAGRVLQFVVENKKPLKKYIGIDFSNNLLTEATQWKETYAPKAPAEFRHGLLQSFEIQDREFDVIVMLASFHHLTTKEDRESCMELCYRALKPGGVLWMTNWNPLNLKKYKPDKIEKLGNDFIIPFTNEKGETYERYYHGFSVEELSQLLLYGGFERVEHAFVTKGEKTSSPEDGWNIISSAVKVKV